MWIGGHVTKSCKRFNVPGHAHELTFSCYQNRWFLKKQQPCQWLSESIQKARLELNFSIWAYVFMPSHVHLLIWPREQEYSISRILHRIKQPVAQKAIAWLKAHNPEGLEVLATGHSTQPYQFWQKGGGYDRNINQIDTLIHCVRYIHLNPVRKNLVQAPEEWVYSSAAEWNKAGTGPLSIDREDWPG